ncbi:di-trans,poly-cis-decaprenylcistransferase [Candidatus Microgenomates bacterium]|nr:di-trans,poly-cis-decaprenylcistransferase [Candidatus Microgenomates bacterium]
MQTTATKVKPKSAPPKTIIPYHLALIIDGNRRWAKERGKSIYAGHSAGFRCLKKIAEAASDRGIKELSCFVFSTENWQRSRQEVAGLMRLVRRTLSRDADELHKKNIRIRVAGLRQKVPADILNLIDKVVAKTKHNTKATINLCFNYGGRPDILQAVKKLIKKGLKPEQVTEKVFSRALSTAGMHDVDLVIRTSEERLSGFLPWESTYAEIYFMPDKYWPDFTETDLDHALKVFANRKRRFGA